MKNLVDDVSSFSKSFVMDGGLNSGKDDGEFNSHRQTYIAEESSIYPSLLEKASNFIQNGELDSIEGKLCCYKMHYKIIYVKPYYTLAEFYM